ncbi:MAG: DNA polymerase ligase N-terminal domain-containing protein [Candidatus Bathyarchaeia archaeon]
MPKDLGNPALEALSKVTSYPEEFGLDLAKPEDRFKWFLASVLFAKRISSEIAKRTFQKFMENNLTTPQKLLDAGWDRLVRVLDSGGYVRYDFSTATNLIEAANFLKKGYGGSLETLHEQARDSDDLEKRLREIRGLGPVALNIFLRELRGRWAKARPKVSNIALDVAERLGISEKYVETYEPKLVRVNLQYCRKGRCDVCPVKNHCKTIGVKDPIYVIHKHAATHLHYDLRLEVGGVLKSWAIPKEPPTQVGIKRLAIETEDHPLDYADFEGEIPEGYYGAGKVEIWDKGDYQPLELGADKIVLELNGVRLRGVYCLIKAGFKGAAKSWLFFKKSEFTRSVKSRASSTTP